MIPRSGHGGSSSEYAITKQAFLNQLAKDYPDFRFKRGAKFAFRPPKTIIVGPPEPHWEHLVLHELGHAILGHRAFRMDVERLKMEAMAWEKAAELAEHYELEFDDAVAQEELDTYRDWLHKKSRCPNCGLTRFQTPDLQYHCPRCKAFKHNKK